MGKPRHQREPQLGSTGTYAALDRGWQITRASTAQQQVRARSDATEAAAPEAMAHPLKHLK